MPAKRFSLFRTALGTTAVLLAIPLVGNLVSAEVHWSAVDFFIAGCLFLSVSAGVLTIWRSLPQRKSIPWIILLLLVFLIIWTELSVGLFGSPIAGS
jgi:hypothetical protein